MTLEDDEKSIMVQETLEGSTKDHLLNTMDEEMKSMRINKVWYLVDFP